MIQKSYACVHYIITNYYCNYHEKNCPVCMKRRKKLQEIANRKKCQQKKKI